MISALTRQNFRGPWTGLPVAWDAAMRFDEKTYREDIARCCGAGVPGIYSGGTTGEFYAMEFDEFKAVAKATVAACRENQTPCLIGCSSTYTLGVIRRAQYAAEIGAQGIQVALPFWMEVPDDQVVPFFAEVAAVIPKLALSVYETKRAKKALTLEQHRQIKQAVPNYLMVKANEGTIGHTAEGCRELAKIVNVFVGEDQWADLGPLGAAGGCASLTYWFPRYIRELWQKVEAGDWAEAKRRCTALGEVFNQLGVLFGGRGFMDSAYDRLGGALIPFLRGGLRGRAPYPSATPADVAALRRWVEQKHPEMLAS